MNFIRHLHPENLPEKILKKGVLAINQEVILQMLYNIALATVTVGLIYFVIASPQVFLSGKIYLYLIGYAVFAAIGVIRKINYVIRATIVILLLQSIGAAALLSYGLSGTGITFLFASMLLAFMLYNRWYALVLNTVGYTIVAIIGWGMVSGNIPVPPVQVLANSGNAVQWITAAIVLLFAVSLTGSSMFAIVRGMNNALLQQGKLTHDLELERASLELRVEERSADLRRRVDQFEIASQIAREISGETSLDKLLNSAANQIRDRFGFYHVGVFFNDEKNEFAVLKAATGEAGRIMLERNHRLKIGEIGMVGYVAGKGEPRISSEVSEDLVYYKNPLLPETRSEMVLPLRTKDRTIGALDVQSVAPDAFDVEDVRILQTIADQFTIAFEKTRLVEEMQRSVDELETTYRSNTQKAWRTHLRNSQQKLVYRYRDGRLENQVDESDHAQEALSKGQPILKVVPGIKGEQGRQVTVLAVPIKIRNQVLGVVDIHFESSNISPDLFSLIEGTVNRLAISLENARLLEEIQFRAERERLVGEISSKVRAASDVDSVLRVAIQEIGRSLGVSEVMVQLRKEQ
jgi:GAF domain-containing protein